MFLPLVAVGIVVVISILLIIGHREAFVIARAVK